MKQIETAREVIEVLGGVKAVSALTGRKTTTVSAWQAKFDSFPSDLFVLMTEALEEEGYTAPISLWRQVEGIPIDDETEVETANA